MLSLNLTHIKLKGSLTEYQDKVNRITDMIATKKGPGGDFLGWDQWPATYDKKEFQLIQEVAKGIRKNFQVLLLQFYDDNHIYYNQSQFLFSVLVNY